MGRKYECNVAKFNRIISPYLSSIFGLSEFNPEINAIIYRPNKDQNSGTRAIVKPVIEIKEGAKFKLVDKVIIDLIHYEKVKELENLIKN